MGVYLRVDQQGWQPGANTIVYYPFNTDFSDQSGNGYDMTGYNSATIGTLNGVSCLDLTANNSYLSAVVSGIPQGGQARTESMRVKWNALGNYPTHSYGRASANQGVAIWTNNHNDYGVLWSNYGGNVVGPGPLDTINTRHHIAVVISGSGTVQNMYVDGVKGVDCSITINTQGTTLYIGYVPRDNRYLNGYISNFIIEDRVRTEQEVLDYYDQTKSNYGL